MVSGNLFTLLNSTFCADIFKYKYSIGNLPIINFFLVSDDRNLIGCQIRARLVIGCFLFPGLRWTLIDASRWREWLPVEVSKIISLFCVVITLKLRRLKLYFLYVYISGVLFYRAVEKTRHIVFSFKEVRLSRLFKSVGYR